ncbi:MAG: DUF1729 domain-containing protein [Patulibacter minatonensis]
MSAPRPTAPSVPPRRGALARASLRERLAAGEVAAALTFAGQGTDPLPELEALLIGVPGLSGHLAAAEEALAQVAASGEARALGAYRHGTDLRDWVRDPSLAPPEADRRAPELSYPLILTAQLLLWQSLAADGVGDALQSGRTPLAAGHSQGLLAALAVSEAFGTPGAQLGEALLSRYVRLAAHLGLALARAGAEVPPTAGDHTPMLSVRRVPRDILEATLGALPEPPQIALVHGPGDVVLGGAPRALAAVEAALAARAEADADAARAGQLGGAPLRPLIEALPVAAPFHTALLDGAREPFAAWLAGAGAADAPRPGALRVLSPLTGTPLGSGDDLTALLLTAQTGPEPLRWDRCIETLRADDPDWILDLGPGTAISRLTADALRGTGIRSLPLSAPDARRVLLTPASHQADRDLVYADLMPGLVELPDGSVTVDTAFTRLHGAPPVVLAGMTPTTTDAGIVAAAANAGFVAELAGGGQPDERTFTERLAELGELLDPGREVAFNTLLLDRHLWDLHVDGAGLVPRARTGGAPLLGLTVSAGIPEVEAAVRLLDRLAAAGLHRNAFKPGTVDQIRQVLAIAGAAPHHAITMHVEGGQGGGHHSWLDLEHLLLETYDEIRRADNVVLAVGGGIGTPERAADFLTGRWSLRRGEAVPMPIDAVLVGTAAMACAEATASPAVKDALVAASGTGPGGWVPRGGVVGGVTSATSNLNADIHLLENAAARAGKLLQEVAGDPEAVQARRDEIIAALAPTAKPYLGDLDALTYLEVLSALTERLATGRGGRYDDGAWGHPTWRSRFLEIARRFAARLDPAERGELDPPLAQPTDLDDPAAALARFERRYPHAASTLLHPADRDVVLEVCDRPGKPVPFVPVLDGEVRRWFMADALWQAQDDRRGFDEVFVIPGPVAVRGIERANEPVGELLQRFHAGTIEALRERDDAPDPVRRDRLTVGGAAPPPLAGIAASAQGPIAALLTAAHVRAGAAGAVPNPIWRLARAGDLLEREDDDAGRLVRLAITPATGLPGERAELTDAGDGTGVLLHAAIPGPDGAVHAFEVTFAPLGAGWQAPGLLAAQARFAADALGAGVGHTAAGAGSWRCPVDLPAVYRRATGATHGATPADLAFTLAWPSVVATLTADPDLAPRLGELVHAEHAVELDATWAAVAGGHGPADARIQAVDDRDGAASAVTVVTRLGWPAGGAPAATVTTRLVFAGTRPLGAARAVRRRQLHGVLELDAPTAALLAELPGLLLEPDWSPAAGEQVELEAAVESTVDHAEPATAYHRCTGGELRIGDRVVGTVAPEITEAAGRGEPPAHPLARLLDALAPEAPAAHPGDRALLGELEDVAPLDLSGFAHVGGDHNPLHRSTLAARLAGLDAPIVHGAWLAARASAALVELATPAAPEALVRWQVQFLAPVPLGAVLVFAARAIGRTAGRQIVEVEVRDGDRLVARGSGEIDLTTRDARAFLFPGQGIQRAGMADELVRSSRAAREVWAAADHYLRTAHGVPLARLVAENPRALRLADGAIVRHPGGLLMRTEYTQPALVALAAAQLAALRADGELPATGGVPVAAGHSVGEFAALHALGVLSLEAALTLVHRRGQAMQRHVPRDAEGRSPFRMAVADPRAMGLTHDELAGAISQIAPSAEIVNENARGRQYAVVGPWEELEALAAAYPSGGSGRSAVRVLDAIDVPFHSSVLRPAASELLAALDAELPATVPAGSLVGRWIPNLTGRPFAATDDAAAAIVAAAALPERPLADLPPADEPDRRARWLLVTALAGQLAAPVRWIGTMEALVAEPGDRAGGLGRRTLIEVAPAHADVLTGLARSGGIADRAAVLHSVRDRAQLTSGAARHDGKAEAEAEVEPEPAALVSTEQAPEPARPAALVVPTARAGADAPGDLPGVDAGTALELVLAIQARIRLDQLPATETLDELFQGVSSRRNQVLIDLGREFSLTGAEGAQGRTIGELTEQLRRGGSAYRYPGDYLRVAIDASLTAGLAGTGLARSAAAEHLTRRGLPPRFVERVLAEVALDLREGASTRGGPLGRSGRPAHRPAALEAIDAAAARVAARAGIALPATPAPDAGDGTAAAPASALSAEAAEVLRHLATDLLGVLGQRPAPLDPAPAGDPAAERLATLEAALGDDLADRLAPAFDPRRHVRLDDAWAHARWDLLDLVHRAVREEAGRAEVTAELARLAPFAADPEFSATASWLAGRLAGLPSASGALDAAELARLASPSAPPRPAALPIAGERPRTTIGADGVPRAGSIPAPERPADLPAAVSSPDAELEGAVRAELAARLADAPDLRDEVALVTGAAPGSIGEATVAQLLRGGATVVATASALTPARRAWAQELYRRSAAAGAVLHLLPANLANTADIDALVAWLANPTPVQRQRPDLTLPSLLPTIVAPLAATGAEGEAGDGDGAELALRLHVTGVHRLVAQLAAHAAPGRRTTVVLPLSPNHGTFGADGIYGETKAALEVLLARAAAGESWAASTALIGARIGWVRGTGLMQAAGLIADDLETELGIRTFSTGETGLLLATLLTGAAREHAQAGARVVVEATGGLRSDTPLRPRLAPLIDALAARAAEAADTAALRRAVLPLAGAPSARSVAALPTTTTDRRAGRDALEATAAGWPQPPTVGLGALVVIAGTGELGPVGSARTRWAREQSAEPSPGAVAELAWLCGLVRYERAGYRGRWIDEASGEPVAEHELLGRYADAVHERTGLRPLDDEPALRARGLQQLAPLTTTRETTFAVDSPADAAPFLEGTPGAVLRQAGDGWEVVVPAGSTLRLPRQIEHSRRAAGQLPRGLDLTRLGAPADLAATADRMALVDLLCTVEAFTEAGLEPGELLEHVHPTQVASTQGAGLGGLASLRRLLLDQLLAEPRQADRIQESLGNVVAAHVVQAFVGSYGPMLHPVGACATAAVSLEAGRDLILAGKALAVVTGGFDDLTAEGLTGFGDMGATASSDDLDALGIAAHEASRPGDVRRRGFVEAQGGGAQLLLRADLAVALGIPARGVLVWAGSFADGLQTSIPAPGLGLLGAAAGGPASALATALAAHGLGADDLAFVSKHDTSTEMNDPGEADLHHRIQAALERSPGNPLPVISQKSLTGHSKGGAAAWQVDGALRALTDGVLPGNRSLECADPALRASTTLIVGRRTIRTAAQLPLRAALVSSLGFGHISALVAVAHPAALVAAIPDARVRDEYLRRAGRRRARGAQRLLAARHGLPVPTRRPAPRAADRDRDAEAARLLAAPPTPPSPPLTPEATA